MSRWQRFLLALKSVPSRIDGSRVELGAEHVTKLSTRAQFPPNESLLLRLAAQRDLIGDREVKADRVLLEDQPDYGESGMVTRRPIG